MERVFRETPHTKYVFDDESESTSSIKKETSIRLGLKKNGQTTA